MSGPSAPQVTDTGAAHDAPTARVARAVWNTLLVTVWTAILVAVPMVLWAWVGWPVPDSSPTEDLRRWAETQEAFRRPEDNPLLKWAACAGWLVWAAATAITAWLGSRRLHHAARRASRALARIAVRRRAHHAAAGPVRRTRRAATTAGARVMAGGMVGTVTAGVAAATTATPAIAADQPADNAPPGGTIDDADPDLGVHPSDTQPTRRQAADAGIGLPDGGWVAVQLATTVAAVWSALWLDRRRRYHPRAPQAVRDDADLAPVPPTLAAILRTVDTDTPQQSTHLPAGDSPAEGIGLTGPGALDAIRGTIVHTLLSAAPGLRVVCTSDLWRSLFDASFDPASFGVHAVADLPAALTLIEDALLADGDPAAETPWAVFAPAPQDAALQRRTAFALTRLHAPHLAAFHGPWERGRTLDVALDGTADDDGLSTTRRATLTATAAADLLTVLTRPAETAARRETPPTGTATAPSCAPAPPWPGTTGLPPEPATTGQPQLRLRLFGSPTLLCHSTTNQLDDIHLPRQTALELLVLLAVHHDGLTTDDIMEAMWPDIRRNAAKARLHTTVSTLRAAAKPVTGIDLVIRDGDTYRLDPTHLTVDLWRYRHAYHRATHTPDHHARQRECGTITDLYHGDLAAPHQWPWLIPHREALRRTTLDVYAALIDNASEPTNKLRLLRDAVDVDPANAHLTEQLVRALTEVGDFDSITAVAARHTAAARVAPR